MADSFYRRVRRRAGGKQGEKAGMRKVLFALAAAPALAAIFTSAASAATCVCGTGKMSNWFPGTGLPGTIPVQIDGDMSDWTSIQANANNNICDGSPAAVTPPDLDAPIQSTGRDLEQFTYTFDANYVYAYTKRYASDSNTDNFIYYADTNNDGLMETGEPVVVVSWQGANRSVSVSLGTYKAYNPGGDSMVCPGSISGQSCTAEFADGYHLPGVIMNLPSAGRPNYSGTWGSTTGTEMEWRVSWADLGMSSNAGKPFTFHVSSTNSQPGAGSFPAQIDDNMGGCGGKGGTTQYAGVTITPNTSIALDPNLTYPHTYTANHTITNTGNGNDNFKLTYAITGSNSGGPSVSYTYNGVSFYNNGYDTKNISPTFSLAPGQSMPVQARYTFNAFPGSNKSYLVTTTATSDFDPNVATAPPSAVPPAQDSLSSQEMISLISNTVGGYGSFTYSNGTNGLPTATQPLTLTTSFGNNPAVSPGYVIANPAQDATVTQTITPGWVFAGASCAYGSTTGTVTYTVDTTTSPGSVILKILRASFTGDNINCTFTNNLLPTIKAYKMLPVARATEGDEFTINLSGGSGTLIQSCRTTGTADQVLGYQQAGTAPCPGPISYKPSGIGVTYSLNEASPAGYAPTLSCTNNTAPVSVPNTLGQTFAPTWGDNYVCYIVNTTLPVLTVAKKTYAGFGTFNFTGSNGANNFAFALGTTSTANPVSSQSYLLPAMNTPTTITEKLDSSSFPAGWAVSGSSCVDAANSTVATTGPGQATVTIPAAAVAPGAKLYCTFENTYEPKLQVAKTADKSGAKPGDLVTYTVQMSNTAGSAGNVVFTDTLSPYAAFLLDPLDPATGSPFLFADGAIPSGLAIGTPLYSRDHGATWTTDVASSGSDATITNWKIPMLGTMNGSSSGTSPYPSFSIKYRVVVR